MIYYCLQIIPILGLKASIGKRNINNAESTSVSMIVNVDDSEEEESRDLEAEYGEETRNC